MLDTLEGDSAISCHGIFVFVRFPSAPPRPPLDYASSMYHDCHIALACWCSWGGSPEAPGHTQDVRGLILEYGMSVVGQVGELFARRRALF